VGGGHRLCSRGGRQGGKDGGTWFSCLVRSLLVGCIGTKWDEDSPLCSTKTAKTNDDIVIVCFLVATLQSAMWHLESSLLCGVDVAGIRSVGDTALPRHVRRGLLTCCIVIVERRGIATSFVMCLLWTMDEGGRGRTLTVAIMWRW
jgi:hypothetical protein